MWDRVGIWENCPKNGENEGKAGRFYIIPTFKKGKAFDPPQRLSQIIKEHKTNFDWNFSL